MTSRPARTPRPIPAQRPESARAAKRRAWTILSTPGGAGGTSEAGANRMASETRTTTAKVPRERVPWTSSAGRIGRSEPVQVGLAVRAHHGQTGVLAEQLGCHVPDLFLVDGVEPGQYLAHRQVLPVGELALAESAHPGAGVLKAEHQRALELATAPGHLLGGDALGGHAVELGTNEPQDLGDALLGATGVHRERAHPGVVRQRRSHAVDQPALLPDLLEQP